LESRLQDLNEHVNSADDLPEDAEAQKWAELRAWRRMLDERLRAARRGLFDRAPWLTKRYEAELHEAELRTCRRDAKFKDLLAALAEIPKPGELFASYARIESCIGELLESRAEVGVASSRFLLDLREEVRTARAESRASLREFAAHAYTAGRLVQEMDFTFLFDSNQEMLRIGYDADRGKLEENHYDLLASEARRPSSSPWPTETRRVRSGSGWAVKSHLSAGIRPSFPGVKLCSSI
jgi:cyclic beta-1,2-glucan synthetase